MSTPNVTERAYLEIKARILDNRIPAGTQLLEKELSEMLDMSRTPIREAAIRLEREGLVAVRPRHGIRVLPVSANDMREIYEVLTDLESTAARRAAERGLNTEELASLEDAVQAMDDALRSENLDQWAQSDERFHKLLVQFSGNQRLIGIVNNYFDQAHRTRMVTLRLRPPPKQSILDHRTVVEAIKRGDADAAYDTHRHHRKSSGALLVALLEKHGLTQL
jgi:DNA-binding GntR family transcriptional regulator